MSVNTLTPSLSPQQVHSARFLATLAFHKSGLAALISHNAVEHLLWAVTCSQCRWGNKLFHYISLQTNIVEMYPSLRFRGLDSVGKKTINSQSQPQIELQISQEWCFACIPSRFAVRIPWQRKCYGRTNLLSFFESRLLRTPTPGFHVHLQPNFISPAKSTRKRDPAYVILIRTFS